MIIKTLIRKELQDYFSSPIAYIYILAFLFISHTFFFKHLFLFNEASLKSFFMFAPYFSVLLVSAISMRTWSEEKKNKTLDFLFTLPITDKQVIFAKYIASLLFIFMIILATVPFLFVILYLGQPDIGPMIISYFALFLLCACFLSIGLCMSSLTDNQIISFLLTLLTSLFFLFTQAPIVLYSFPKFMTQFLHFISLENHYLTLIKGVVTFQTILYFASFIFTFLFLNAQILSNRLYKK